MITDEKLDVFNRLMMGYVFLNYNYHLSDEKHKSENAIVLKNAIATLPESIAKGFEID